jgi:hypothetical protein
MISAAKVDTRAEARNINPPREFEPSDRENRPAEQILAQGIRSTDPVVVGHESVEDWIAHRDTVVQELCPVGALETAHAQRAALYLWRLNRVIRFENAATQVNLDEVIHEFMIALDNPDLLRDRSEAMTLEKIRKPLGEFLDQFAMLGADARKLPEQKDGLAKIRGESKRVRERRVLPDHPTIQTIIKYEAHLDRCLARTMAELRRLQKERRRGLRTIDERFSDTHEDLSGEPTEAARATIGVRREPVSGRLNEPAGEPIVERENKIEIKEFENAKSAENALLHTQADAITCDEADQSVDSASNSRVSLADQSVDSASNSRVSLADRSVDCEQHENEIDSTVLRGESPSRSSSPTRIDSLVPRISPAPINSTIPVNPPLKPCASSAYLISESTPGGIVVRDPSKSGVIITMIPKPVNS